MRIKLIACKSLWREISTLSAGSTHDIDISYLPPRCERDINAYINKIENNFDAVVLAVGLCALPEDGLSSIKHRIVIPKAHNPASILLGSRNRYRGLCEGIEGDILWLNRSFDEFEMSEHISGKKYIYDYRCAIQSPISGYYQPEGGADREYMADLSLLKALVSGDWNSPEILVLERGELAYGSYDCEVIRKESCSRVSDREEILSDEDRIEIEG